MRKFLLSNHYSFFLVFVFLLFTYPGSETNLTYKRKAYAHEHIFSVIYNWFFFFLPYAASISSLFYDHAADEATVGVHPGGNAKQGMLSLLSQPYIMGRPPHFCYSANSFGTDYLSTHL